MFDIVTAIVWYKQKEIELLIRFDASLFVQNSIIIIKYIFESY